MKWPSDKIFLYGIVILFSFLPLASAQKVQRNNSGMLRQTAQMYERAGQLPQAAEYYARACRENPADISAYLGAKRAYMRIQEFDKFSSLINVLQQRRRDVRYQVDLVFIDFK